MAVLAGCYHERARALEHGFHLRDGENPAGKLGQVAMMEKIRQQLAVAGEQRVRGFKQIVEELLSRLSGRPDMESVLDVIANDFGDGKGELAGALRSISTRASSSRSRAISYGSFAVARSSRRIQRQAA